MVKPSSGSSTHIPTMLLSQSLYVPSRPTNNARRIPAGASVVSCSVHRAARSSSRTLQPVRCQASGDPTMDLTINEERWKKQVREGKIRNVSAQDAGAMLKEGWSLLDVRPPFEAEKVGVTGSVHIPLFVMDPDTSFGGMVKQATNFGMGGWWLGGGHTIPNRQFAQQVEQQLPDKEQGVIVACQKGLRSLAAAEALVRAGYSNVAWISGGLDTAKSEALPTSNGKDLRYGGIGGLSEALGWTEVQQEEKKTAGPSVVIKVAAVVLALDLLLFAYEQVNYMINSGQ